MEFLTPMFSLLVGGVVGILGTLITARQKYYADLQANQQKFRDDLQARYDQTLHDHRIKAYQALWQRLEVLALYARPEPVTSACLKQLAAELRQWYFHTGGLFLTDNSRDAYFALQIAIKAEIEKQQPQDKELEDPAFETIRTKGSALRTSLSSDLNSRKQPLIE